MSDIRVLILAGGKGTRMGAEVPKALVPVCEKPIIDHMIDAVAESGVDQRPYLVIGHDLVRLQEHTKDRAGFVIQTEQKGTGHAVMVARDQLKDVGTILVAYGDHPLFSPEDYATIYRRHKETDAVITFLTTRLPDYDGWRSVYTHFGRILRDEDREVLAIKEYKFCSDEEKAITEVNNGMYCFDGVWLWENIDLLSGRNGKGEYLLTDLVEIALNQGKVVSTSQCDPECGIGVNTPAEVAIAEEVLCGKGSGD